MIHPKKILIIRLSSIGDIILTTPLIRAVRKQFPEAEIDFLVKTEFSDLLKYNLQINKIIKFDKNLKIKGLNELKNQIQAQKYDWIIDLHKNLRSRYLVFFSNAKLITNYSKQYWYRTLLILFKINLYPKPIKKVYLHYFDAVSVANIIDDDQGTEIFFSEKENQNYLQIIENQGYKNQKPILAICPAASANTKKWLSDGFAKVADHFAKKYEIVLLGGKADIEICEEVRSKMQSKAINLAGKTNLLESAVLLKNSVALVCNDTGMMHLAQSQKTPVVGIFGSTTEELGYFPLESKSKAVQADVPCRPCTHNGKNACPKGHFDCMQKIAASQVILAVEDLLA
ncbi:MAG: lipopolysaccharide heptosyltransferase II [Bacteroidetes bacterium]|nr:MAG: lipopolysaccharide heptosyltransferase II [Bacteroidota bacterium]